MSEPVAPASSRAGSQNRCTDMPSVAGQCARSGAYCACLLPMLLPCGDDIRAQKMLQHRIKYCLMAFAGVWLASRGAESRFREVGELFSSWLHGAVAVHFLFVCAGAPLFRRWLDTLLSASLLSAALVASASELAPAGGHHHALMAAVKGVQRVDDPRKLVVSVQVYSTLVGCLAGLWPLPLDKESAVWQVWPFGLVVGTAAGSFLGHLLSVVLFIAARRWMPQRTE